jgi:hypothetical protein
LEQAFWCAVTLALLGVLIGLLTLMIVQDVRAVSEHERQTVRRRSPRRVLQRRPDLGQGAASPRP